MANGTTKNMPEWKKVTISYCHRNWNHQRPVELQFNRKDPYAPLTPPDSAKIIVGLNGSGKSTLLKTINHFFSLIGGFKHPTDIQIEDFKTKCIERGVGTFQVEIQFDIHRVEPMGRREQDPYVLKFPDLTNFEHYRQTLEEDSSLEKVNDTLLLGPDDEEWGWFSEYIGTIGPITREHHIEYIVTDEVYMEGVKAILCIWAEEFSIVKCTSKYSFEFLSNKFSSNIEIEWERGAHHHELDHEDLDIEREHIFNWNSEKCAFGPSDFEKIFLDSLNEYENKFNSEVDIIPSAIVSLPLFETAYLSSEVFQKPILEESAFSILDTVELDSFELERYLEKLNTNQLLELMDVERNDNPLRTYEEFPVDELAGSIEHFEFEGGQLFRNDGPREKIEIDSKVIKAPTLIHKLGAEFNPHHRAKNNGWDKYAQYHDVNSLWCIRFNSKLPSIKRKSIDFSFVNEALLLRSHNNTICDLREGIVYNTKKQALAEFVKYELIRYLDEREKCEVLSKIFKTDVHELLALYVLKSFCGNIESYLTSGQQKIYTIFSEISKKEKTIFLIDEPEVSLHIDWQRKIVDQILDIARSGFVLIATHSPDIIYNHHEKVQDLGSEIEE